MGTACSADSDYRVKWVVDGDTIVLNEGSKVRYIGINAPELQRDDHIGEPYANEAKRLNARLVNNKKCAWNSTSSRTIAFKDVWHMFFWKTAPLSTLKCFRRAALFCCMYVRM